MTARTHALKTWPEAFEAVQSGAKTWEFRRDDRGFMVGDTLRLEWWDPTSGNSGNPVGYSCGAAPGFCRVHIECTVTYILHGSRFGIPEGYCVMSIVREGE